MKKTISLSIFLIVCSLTSFSQIKLDTLYFNKIEIRIFTYRLNHDTVVHAYFDQSTPRVWKKIDSNIGRIKYDLTLKRITNFVQKNYPSPLIAPTNFHLDKPLSFYPGDTPELTLAIAKDSYCIGAINFYQRELEKNAHNYLFYYELAKAYDTYRPYDPIIHEQVLAYLATCLKQQPAFEEAYLLKARTHEKNGKMKGMMMSEPHVDMVDMDEIRQAIKCLEKLLLINPARLEAKQYLTELKDRYGKTYGR